MCRSNFNQPSRGRSPGRQSTHDERIREQRPGRGRGRHFGRGGMRGRSYGRRVNEVAAKYNDNLDGYTDEYEDNYYTRYSGTYDEYEDKEELDDFFLGSLYVEVIEENEQISSVNECKTNENVKEWRNTVKINGKNISMKLDTGAEANILSERML